MCFETNLCSERNGKFNYLNTVCSEQISSEYVTIKSRKLTQ